MALIHRAVILAGALGSGLTGLSASAHADPVHEASDASRLPRDIPPSPHDVDDGHGDPHRYRQQTIGWARILAEPALTDHRRRIPRTGHPPPHGATLAIGEAFRYDLTFAGNPAGIAEASIVAYEPDPRGPPPLGAPTVRIEGHARTSGIVSLLATVTDDMISIVDAQTGASISCVSTIHYDGFSPVAFKHRVTEHLYHGRGYIHIKDTKDADLIEKTRHVPLDTFDPLSAMAWVRSLPLDEGSRAKAHVVDGTTLMRFEIESKGRKRIPDMPSIGTALGLDPSNMILIEGTLTRVDPYDQPLPGKRVFVMRAWLSGDGRRLPVALESDMWVGAVRLAMTGYDPPRERPAPQATSTRSGDAAASRAKNDAAPR